MPELSETFKRLERDPHGGSQHLLALLETFFFPWLLMLDEVLDKRLVRTFLQCLVTIIRLRNNPQALWRERTGGLSRRVRGLLFQRTGRDQASRQEARGRSNGPWDSSIGFSSRKRMKK